MLYEDVNKADLLIQSFNLSHQPTHTHGGILDLVFDTLNSNTVSSLTVIIFFFFPNLMHFICVESSCQPH